MKLAITGSSGFLGSHLCQFYKDHTVLKVSRDYWNDLNYLKEKLEDFNPDIIIHCAAFGNMSYQKDEEEIFQANVVKTWQLLQATKNIDYKKFVFISSSSVYGEKTTSMGINSTLDTDTFYGCTKVSAEYLCRAFRKQYKKNILIARPFSLFGEGEADFRFIPTICRSLLTDTQFTLDVEAIHDWIYIEDFIKAIDRNLNSGEEVISVGSGVQVKNYKIVEMLAKISGKQPKIKMNYVYHPETWVSAKGSSSINLYNGLERVWNYEKQRFEKENSTN